MPGARGEIDPLRALPPAPRQGQSLALDPALIAQNVA